MKDEISESDSLSEIDTEENGPKAACAINICEYLTSSSGMKGNNSGTGHRYKCCNDCTCDRVTARGNAHRCCKRGHATASHSSNCSKCRDSGGGDFGNISCSTPSCCSCSPTQDRAKKHQTEKPRQQVRQENNANISKKKNASTRTSANKESEATCILEAK